MLLGQHSYCAIACCTDQPEFFIPLSLKDAKEASLIITRMKESAMQDLGIDVTGEE